MNEKPLPYWNTVSLRFVIILTSVACVVLSEALAKTIDKNEIITGTVAMSIMLISLSILVFVPLTKKGE